MFIIFFGKVLDDLLFAMVNIFTYKGEKLKASITRALNTLVFFMVIAKVITDLSLEGVLLVTLASFIGRYLSFKLDAMLTKDEYYLFFITYKGNKKDLQAAIDELRDMRIDVFSFKTYHGFDSSSLSLKIVSKDRQTSRIIKEVMPRDVEIKAVPIKAYY
jgi:uncharacterized protein YebE (UPF0316 family)